MNETVKKYEKLAIIWGFIGVISIGLLGAGFTFIEKTFCSTPYKKTCLIERCETKMKYNPKLNRSTPRTTCKCSQYGFIENPCYRKEK